MDAGIHPSAPVANSNTYAVGMWLVNEFKVGLEYPLLERQSGHFRRGVDPQFAFNLRAVIGGGFIA
jgi:hypothetical protein